MPEIGEFELSRRISQDISKPGFLIDFANDNLGKHEDLCVQISTILALPERILKFDLESLADPGLIDGNFGLILANRIKECLLDSSFSSFDWLSELLERLVRLKMDRPLANVLIEESPPTFIDSWTLVLARLSLQAKYQIFKSVLSEISTRLFEQSSTEFGFPLTLNSPLNVPFEVMDEYSSRLSCYFYSLLSDSSHESFKKYLIKKMASDFHFSNDQNLAIRYVLVKFSQYTGLMDTLFAQVFLYWSNKDFIITSILPYHHAYICDLLSLCLNFIVKDMPEHGLKFVMQSIEKNLSYNLTSIFNNATSLYLECTDVCIRTNGLLTAEKLANVLISPNLSQKLNFKLESSMTTKWIDYLVSDVPDNSFERQQCVEKEYEAEIPDSKEDNWDSDDSEISLESFKNAKMSEFPPPRLLKDCLYYLRQDNTPESGDMIETCLVNLENFIRDRFINSSKLDNFKDREFRELAPLLFKKLLHLHEPYEIQNFDSYRFRGLTCLCVADFELIGQLLVDQFWSSKGLNWTQRMELMDVLIQASLEYVGIAENRHGGNWSVLSSLDSSLTLKRTPDSSSLDMKSGKTRIIHPHSLRLAREKTVSKPQINLWKGMEVLFVKLCRGLWTTPLQWLKKESGVYCDISQSMKSTFDCTREDKEISASTLLLLCKWVTTLVFLLRISGPNDPQMINYCKELGFVMDWFWEFIHTRSIRSVSTVGNRENQPNLVIVRNTGAKLLNHPQVKFCLLFAFSSIFDLNENMPHQETYSTLPFGWLEKNPMFIPDEFVHWLVQDVVMIDSNVRNVKMASYILSRLSARHQPGQ